MKDKIKNERGEQKGYCITNLLARENALPAQDFYMTCELEGQEREKGGGGGIWKENREGIS